MEIVFLGTGGGRINLVKQVRATGGFRINSKSANIHVDPGPGSLVHSIKNRQDPLKLDCIIVSHNHTDHVSDAQVLVEGMTGYCLKKRGLLICSRNVVEQNGISRWHQSKIGTVHVAEFGEKKTFKTEKGSFDIEIIEMKHKDEPTFGFKLDIDGVVIGYVSDSEYVESFGTDFAGCDYLIVSCLKPEHDRYVGHMTTAGVTRILKKAKPKQAIIMHFGMKLLRLGPANVAKEIEEKTGVRTLAAKDGMRIGILSSG